MYVAVICGDSGGVLLWGYELSACVQEINWASFIEVWLIFFNVNNKYRCNHYYTQ